MPSDRTALVILLVGLLLVPGPAYAFALDDLGQEERHRSSTGYSATEVDVSNDTVLADRYGTELSVRPSSFQYRHVRERYRAPNRTRETLEAAMADGDAAVESDAVAADLRRLDRNHSFLTAEYDTYYAFDVADGELTATPANDAEVAGVVRDQLVVNYSALPPDERRTFRKIRNATASEEAFDYRPWSDEPVPERPIVERDGRYYAVEVTSHTDDFDFPDGLLLGLAGSGVGVVAVVGGLGTLGYNRWRG
ncbi:hypothetical protein Hbl1158_00720 [Halobaculum sp. CBA1158]|uniref:hypothetical protein n=1 Tax=Halobaculum sp. CBA1158 TaxID=2904243 RepID=UPI001F4871A3|nr:hypothetical protein [Halobaculum sp. CBA1158]UIO99930.1 hypothetical protein Hbl1158_00720 [Halobaculum sp. CBA1158]